jgi:hypothetical protein
MASLVTDSHAGIVSAGPPPAELAITNRRWAWPRQRQRGRRKPSHRDGRPFTAEETDLLGSAIDDDMRAAASELAAAPERLAELFMPYIRTVAKQISDHPPTTQAP